jgi:hypothetical protein
MIDMRMTDMQKHKDCITAAKSMNDMKTCRLQNKENHMEMKKEMMQHRMEKLKERQEKKTGA